MAFSMTSNRGMSGFPSNYAQAWNAYNPFPQQGGGGLTGKAARNANAAENMAYAQGGGAGGTMGLLQQLLGGQGGNASNPGGGHQASVPYRQKSRSGPGAPGTRLSYPQQGGSGGQAGGGQVPVMGGNIPPATTNPQTPVAVNPLAGLAEQSPGITSGQLSNDAIAQALASLTGAGTGGYSGGSFGDLMRMNTQRAAGELQRGGAEQQADMQQAFEVARANAGLQQMQLGSDINREHVMNQVMQRNNIFDLLRGVIGGLI